MSAKLVGEGDKPAWKLCSPESDTIKATDLLPSASRAVLIDFYRFMDVVRLMLPWREGGGSAEPAGVSVIQQCGGDMAVFVYCSSTT
jgi:hypothetical protein